MRRTPLILVVAALLGAACLGRDPLLVPHGHAADDTSAAAAPAQPGAADTLYGAKFEPPRGRILHGMGQFDEGNAGYLSLLDPGIQPASKLDFLPIGDWPRPWDNRLQVFRASMKKLEDNGRIPHIDIALYGLDPNTRKQVSVDLEVANTTRYDQHILELAQVIASHKGPVFLRIGGEFSGDWMDYHPYDYPRAYRKVADIFRGAGADNVAFVWCYEPSAPDDFDVHDARGWKWFPGDDVIDWYGIDLFAPDQFSRRASGRGSDEKLAHSEKFLKMARDHKKPVMIGECSPSQEDITDDAEDGRRDWQSWFQPFLKFLDDHPEVEAFYFINYDWRKSRSLDTNGWQDAEIQKNPYIGPMWVKEMQKPRYLHLDDVKLLNGYAAACTNRPKYAGPGPAEPSSTPPGR
jgi:hypothetical protein